MLLLRTILSKKDQKTTFREYFEKNKAQNFYDSVVKVSIKFPSLNFYETTNDVEASHEALKIQIEKRNKNKNSLTETFCLFEEISQM